MVFDREGFNFLFSSHCCLNKLEVAWLCFVTRQTLHNWLNGGEPKNEFLLQRVNRVIAKAKEASMAGDLPISKRLKNEAREDRLRIVFAELAAW